MCECAGERGEERPRIERVWEEGERKEGRGWGSERRGWGEEMEKKI